MQGSRAEPIASVEARRCQWRVLLAEDDVLLANTVHDFLSDEGFEVALATDGRQALERACTATFDVLLTDLRMPHIDGAELVRRLRADHPKLPVVVMSGNAPANLWARLTRDEDGPTMIVNKPMRLQHLLHALLTVLGKPERAC